MSIAAARALSPEIAARAPEFARARRLPEDLARHMARAGLFRMAVPRAIGGSEASPREIAETIETVAQADASAGWCVMIATTTALASAYLPDDVARAVFGAPEAITGGVFAPLGRAIADGDDYVVSGRWKWASGSQNCDWLVGGAMIYEGGVLRTLPNGQPDHRMMIFPADEVELIDTWHVAGLEGTGSLDMQVADVRVPRRRSVSLIADKPRHDGPLYAFPAFGLLAVGVAAVALGNARAAIEALIALAGAKRPQGARRTLAERGSTQAEVARAEALLRAARAFLHEAIDAAWTAAGRAGALTACDRALLRLAATHAARTSAEVARMMYDLGGGSSVFLDCPLQKRFRDAHVPTQHIMVAPPTFELAGRTLLGLINDDASF
jgi:alkylation response protein AidB-like acyl-CoA dehydrogenase